MTRVRQFVKKYIPISAIVCAAVFVISLIVYIIARFNTSFADFISGTIGAAVRVALSYTVGIPPFSLAEILLLSLPLILTVIILIIVKFDEEGERFWHILVTLLSVLAIIYSFYVFTIGAGYHTTELSDKTQISDSTPTKDELEDTLLIVRGELDKLLPEIEFSEDGSSVCPLNTRELSEVVVKAYDKIIEAYPTLGIHNFNQRAKPVIMSKGMTYLEILGIYSFFTGESNVNVHYPDYNLPFTVAHEFAHARGVSRENEANFVAFLVCISSDNAYVKYSAYMTMYEYLASALQRADKELLFGIYKTTDKRIMGELAAYSDYYYENKVQFLADISKFVNDNYLKAQGSEGVVSYGLVVRLCVGYYKDK